MSGDERFAELAATFEISLDGEFGSICAAYDCNVEATLVVTLAYCHCDAKPRDHGHPGYGGPEMDRCRALVCEKHGSLIAHSWEAFERLQNFTAAGMTDPPTPPASTPGEGQS